jgi:hypothetical protein
MYCRKGTTITIKVLPHLLIIKGSVAYTKDPWYLRWTLNFIYGSPYIEKTHIAVYGTVCATSSLLPTYKLLLRNMVLLLANGLWLLLT